MTHGYSYLRDPAEIYRQSFAVIEAEVQRLAPDLFLHVTLTIMDTLSRQLTRLETA